LGKIILLIFFNRMVKPKYSKEEEGMEETLPAYWFKSNKPEEAYKRPKSLKQIVDSLPPDHQYLACKAPFSLLPKNKYCDITGLETIHTDPKTGLRFYDASCYQLIRQISPNTVQAYLQVRNAAVILK
jgi:hypothetical protein